MRRLALLLCLLAVPMFISGTASFAVQNTQTQENLQEIDAQTILPYVVGDEIYFEQQLSGTSLALLSIFSPKSAHALRSFDESIGIVTVSNSDLVEVTCDTLKFQLKRLGEGEYDLVVEEDGKILLSATELVATQRDGLVIFYEEGEQAYALATTEDGALMLQKLGSGPRDLLKLTCRREKNEEAGIDPDPWVPAFGMYAL